MDGGAVAVIGAGLAGLGCARTLAAGGAIVLKDNIQLGTAALGDAGDLILAHGGSQIVEREFPAERAAVAHEHEQENDDDHDPDHQPQALCVGVGERRLIVPIGRVAACGMVAALLFLIGVNRRTIVHGKLPFKTTRFAFVLRQGDCEGGSHGI